MNNDRPHEEIPATGQWVQWRDTGHVLVDDTDVLRFETADTNRVITSSLAVADLYRTIQDMKGQPAEWQVLVLSCFAVAEGWTPERLAAQTGYRQYREVAASSLIKAGFELWPTETFLDGVPDERNEVHYDLVVAAGPVLIPEVLINGSKTDRRSARDALRPRFEAVLAVLGESRLLHTVADEAETGTMSSEEDLR